MAPLVIAGAVASVFVLSIYYYFKKKKARLPPFSDTSEILQSDENLGERTDPLGGRPILLADILKNTRLGILGKIQSAFSGRREVAAKDLAHLEEILYGSDLGPKTVNRLMTVVSEKTKNLSVFDVEFIKSILREEMTQIFSKVAPPQDLNSEKPVVWLVVGVNGVGKTTTIGKLARLFSEHW